MRTKTIQGVARCGVWEITTANDPRFAALRTGEGPREVTEFVRFNSPCDPPPTISVALAGLDVDNGANTRISLEVGRVDRDGFELIVRTWWNTRIWGLRVSWIAFV